MVAMTDIREIRKSLRMTQAELADKLGVHQATVSRLETGELPLDKRTMLAVQALAAGAERAA